MKKEARVLASSCAGGFCCGYIVRGLGVDGFIASSGGCDGLCRRASELGFMEELRYHYGDCRCGLPEPPSPGPYTYYLKLSLEACTAISSLARTL